MNKSEVEKVMEALGPAAKGSLVEVRKPCIRPGCQACKSGLKHRAFMFHFSQDGKRRCMYVPLACVPQLEEALRRGRMVEECLHEAGPELIKAARAGKSR